MFKIRHIYIIDEHQSSKQNGVGTYIRQLLKCLEDSGHDLTLLSFNSDEKEFKVERVSFYDEYHFPVCNNGGFLESSPLFLSLLRLYVQDGEDNVFIVNHFPCDKFLTVLKHHYPKSRTIFVIHDQGWCAPLLGDARLFRKILSTARTSKKDNALWQSIRQMARREKRMYRQVDDIIALSQTTYDLLLDVYKVSADKVRLIPNGLQHDVQILSNKEKQDIRRRLGVGEDDIILLYTGRTTKSKGVQPLLQAFDRLCEEHPNLRLVIAGQVFTFNEFALQTPHCAARVTYTGLLSKDQLADWYQIADIGVLPSYTEQSSYTGIEMLSYGKLIVSTDGHNLTDMFSDGTAVIAPIGEQRATDTSFFVSSLVNAILTALAMKDEYRQQMQEQALRRYQQAYSFNQWKASYSRLINGSLFEDSYQEQQRPAVDGQVN